MKYKNGHIGYWKGKKRSKETKNKMSESSPKYWKGKSRSEETKLKISKSHKGKKRKPFSEEHKKNIGLAMKGKKFSKEHKNKIKEKCWSNPDHRDKQTKAILKGLLKRPTSLEQEFINIINKHNLSYKYTGDGDFILGGKNPDFVNVNSQKICVEVGNTYHHDENYESERVKHFAKYGWKCVVFRTNQLDEEEVVNKLR